MYKTCYTIRALLIIYNRTAKTVMGTIAMGMFCLGIFLAGVFPTYMPVELPTHRGLIHGLAALIALFSLAVAMIAWVRSFRKNDGLKSISK